VEVELLRKIKNSNRTKHLGYKSFTTPTAYYCSLKAIQCL